MVGVRARLPMPMPPGDPVALRAGFWTLPLVVVLLVCGVIGFGALAGSDASPTASFVPGACLVGTDPYAPVPCRHHHDARLVAVVDHTGQCPASTNASVVEGRRVLCVRSVGRTVVKSAPRTLIRSADQFRHVSPPGGDTGNGGQATMRGFGRRGRAALFAVALVAAPASAVVLTAAAAGAVTVTVDNTGDPAVGNPANCPAVPAGTCTLRDAIAATDVGAADTVSITVGPISLTQGTLAHAAATALSIEGNGNSVVQTTANDLLHTNGPLTVDGLVASGGNTTLERVRSGLGERLDPHDHQRERCGQLRRRHECDRHRFHDQLVRSPR